MKPLYTMPAYWTLVYMPDETLVLYHQCSANDMSEEAPKRSSSYSQMFAHEANFLS